MTRKKSTEIIIIRKKVGEYTGREKPKRGFTWWYNMFFDENSFAYIELVQRRITTLPKVAYEAYSKKDGFKTYKKFLTEHKSKLGSELHRQLVEDVANS